MKLYFFTVLSLGMIFLSCRTGIRPTNCREGRCTYEVLPNSQLETWTDSVGPDSTQLRFRIEDGQNTVFRYTYNYNDDPDIMDDEYMELLLFEVDKDSSKFFFEDSAMLQTKFLFHPSCECLPGTTFITDGALGGVKENENSWEVGMNVRFDYGPSEEIRIFTTRWGVVD